MTSIHDKSSFIPGGGNVQNSHRNTFLGEAEGDNVQLTKHAKKAKNVRGDASTSKKRTGVPKIGSAGKTVPKRGSMRRITPS
jgi:hypothetical protein